MIAAGRVGAVTLPRMGISSHIAPLAAAPWAQSRPWGEVAEKSQREGAGELTRREAVPRSAKVQLGGLAQEYHY